MTHHNLTLLLIVLLAGSTEMVAQPQKIVVSCGKKISLEFTSSGEAHEIKIKLEAGDRLQIRVTPTGDYLNVRAEIYDPAGGKIYSPPPSEEPMFREGLRFLEVTTGQLSARGEYTIKLYNYPQYRRQDSMAGEYSFLSTCFKKDGTVIEN